MASNTRRLLRAHLRSRPANGHSHFVPHCRKLVFEYSDSWPSSENTRTFIHNHIRNLALRVPHVELVVKQRDQKEPVLRGFYANNRDKVIPLQKLEVNQIANKVSLLLDSSGAQVQPLKRRAVQSTTESTRGIWSGMHADLPQL